jgi:hypothetical protein
MTYEMRDICAKDIFPFVSIIRKIGLDEIAECFGRDRLTKLVENVQHKNDEDSENTTDIAREIGIDVIMKITSIIINNMSKIEDDIFNWFSSFTGQKRETIENMPIDDFVEQIKTFLKKPELESFISAASKYIN